MKVVLLSLNTIIKSIPINHSQSRCLVYSLPMRHVNCTYQVLEAKFTKRGVLDFLIDFHDEVTLFGLIYNKVSLVEVIIQVP